MKQNICIYRIVGPNGLSYIGSTANDPSTRFKHHMYLLRRNGHYNSHLQADFNTHGEKSFKLDILQTISESNKESVLLALETLHIEIHNFAGGVYNVTTPNTNVPFKKKSRKSFSVRFRGKVEEIDLEGKAIAEWDSLAECSRATGISDAMISRVCIGTRNHTHGRRFRRCSVDAICVTGVKDD